jgi:hypothetical protein
MDDLRSSSRETDLTPFFLHYGLPSLSTGWDLLLHQALERQLLDLVAALESLRLLFGEFWLGGEGSFRLEVPPFLFLSPFHAQARERAIQLAGQFERVRKVSGFAKVMKDLTHRKASNYLHAYLQVETADLVMRQGLKVEFEPKDSIVGPADVLISGSMFSFSVDTRVVLKSDRWRKGEQMSDEISSWRMAFEHETGLRLRSDASALQLPAPEGLITLIDEAAIIACTTNEWPAIASGVVVDLRSDLDDEVISEGPRISEQDFRRVGNALADKAAEYTKTPTPTWVRLDALDGFWQFSPVAGLSMAGKVSAIAALVRLSLNDESGIDGVVLSSGAALSLGPNFASSCRGPNGIGLRVVLSPFTVRETVIIPLTEIGASHVPLWVSMYVAEPSSYSEASVVTNPHLGFLCTTFFV